MLIMHSSHPLHYTTHCTPERERTRGSEGGTARERVRIRVRLCLSLPPYYTKAHLCAQRFTKVQGCEPDGPGCVGWSWSCPSTTLARELCKRVLLVFKKQTFKVLCARTQILICGIARLEMFGQQEAILDKHSQKSVSRYIDHMKTLYRQLLRMAAFA